METVYQLTQGFMSMLHQQQAEPLTHWLAAMQSCGMAELERFDRGIEQDQATVVVGLTLPYSNGVVEGHVNRLKLIKRMMYGHAEFPSYVNGCYTAPKRRMEGNIQRMLQGRTVMQSSPPGVSDTPK